MNISIRVAVFCLRDVIMKAYRTCKSEHCLVQSESVTPRGHAVKHSALFYDSVLCLNSRKIRDAKIPFRSFFFCLACFMCLDRGPT